MHSINLPYGDSCLTAAIPEYIKINIIDPARNSVREDVTSMIKKALQNPIGTLPLEQIVQPSLNICIIVNDQTRPGPTAQMLDEILPALYNAGVTKDHITIIVATGSHRGPTESELDVIIGTQHRDIKVVVHDCKQNNVYIGTTKSGLPVWIDKIVAESDFVIATGLIAPHHSAGYSGGRKSILPGIAGLETLKQHHSFPIRPYEPAMGFYTDNPFHITALEAARKTNLKFIVNVVQDPHKQVISCVAGDVDMAHQAGVAICKKACSVSIGELADIVITSPGGAPRDCNLYQSQKALSVAEKFGKQGCTYILCSECKDGIGEGVFEEWMSNAKTPEEIIERFKKEGYNVGSNKAFMYARTLTKGNVIVVTNNIDPSRLDKIMLQHASTLQEAIDRVCAQKPVKNITVIPRAINIIPC